MTDRPLVAVRLAAGPQWRRTVDAVWDSGGAVLPLPVDAPARVVADLLAAMRPSRLIDASGDTRLDGGIPVAPDTAVVVVTSGSTGAPKGVELSAAALEWSARTSLQRLAVGPGDRWLCCLPLHHVAGLQVLTRSRLMGTAPVILERFAVAEVAEHRNVTLIALVPTMLRRLLDAGVDLSHLRCVLLGGAPAGQPLLDDAHARGLRVVTTYGMTETCGGCVYDGFPLDGVDVAIDDDGRIRLRGPLLFSGYRNAPQATASALRDGWLVTEDLGRWAPGGRLEVLGRADDMIVTGGENVAAAAVAAALEQHPAITEAAAVGVDDAEWGQRVVAVIVADSVLPAPDELRRFVAERLGRQAAPREVVAVPRLPRLDNGKLDRLAVARLAAGGA